MKTAILLTLAFVICAAPVAGQPAASSGLIPPPAINIPYGGKVITEVNLSDDDVLGIIKQALPQMGQVLATVAPVATSAKGVPGKTGEAAAAALSHIDFAELAEAISGITNVRALVATYPPGVVDGTDMLSAFDKGVAKIGRFSRIIADAGLTPGVVAVYAQADDGGYIGYGYDPGSRMLYAGRVVGSVDVARLTKWFANVIQAVAVFGPPPSKPAEPQPEVAPEPVPAPEEPASEPAAAPAAS